MSGHWNNDLTEVAPILTPIYKRATATVLHNDLAASQKHCGRRRIPSRRSLVRCQWATTSPPNDIANNEPPSTKRQSQQCATIFFSQWANTSPPMGQHIANYDPPYFSPHEPPNLRLLSHHIFDYWATIQYLQPKMSHPISNQTRASTSSIICHHIFSTHLA